MGGDKAVIVAGIGCRRLCPAEEIAALVREALARAGCAADTLAAPAFRQEAAGAARALGLPLVLVGEAALRDAGPRCVTHSAVSMRHAGLPSVAEAAALAAAGPGSRLVLARIAGARATCALAESAP